MAVKSPELKPRDNYFEIFMRTKDKIICSFTDRDVTDQLKIPYGRKTYRNGPCTGCSNWKPKDRLEVIVSASPKIDHDVNIITVESCGLNIGSR